jgi:hypothetical protein
MNPSQEVGSPEKPKQPHRLFSSSASTMQESARAGFGDAAGLR